MNKFNTQEDAEVIATMICKIPTSELGPEIKTVYKELQTKRSKLLALSSVMIVSLRLQALGVIKAKAGRG